MVVISNEWASKGPQLLQHKPCSPSVLGNRDVFLSHVEIPTFKKNDISSSNPIVSSTVHLEQPLKAEYPKVYRSDGVRHVRCFPNCCEDRHYTHRYCGQALRGIIKFDTPPDLSMDNDCFKVTAEMVPRDCTHFLHKYSALDLKLDPKAQLLKEIPDDMFHKLIHANTSSISEEEGVISVNFSFDPKLWQIECVTHQKPDSFTANKIHKNYIINVAVFVMNKGGDWEYVTSSQTSVFECNHKSKSKMTNRSSRTERKIKTKLTKQHQDKVKRSGSCSIYGSESSSYSFKKSKNDYGIPKAINMYESWHVDELKFDPNVFNDSHAYVKDTSLTCNITSDEFHWDPDLFIAFESLLE